jgi:hypothetical protein
MRRLTITISGVRYRAPKEASALRDKTIGQLIEESLEFYGIKTRAQALIGRTPDLPCRHRLWSIPTLWSPVY